MNAQEQSEYIGSLDDIILQSIIRTREERGVKKSEMAKLLGISQAGYGQMEKGIIRIDMKRMLVIMKHLDIDYPFSNGSDVIEKEKPKELLQINPNDLIKIFQDLTDTNKEILKNNYEMMKTNNDIKDMLKDLLQK